MPEPSTFLKVLSFLIKPLRYIFDLATRRSHKIAGLRNLAGFPLKTDDYESVYDLVAGQYGRNRPDSVREFLGLPEVKEVIRSYCYDETNSTNVISACKAIAAQSRSGDAIRNDGVSLESEIANFRSKLDIAIKRSTPPLVAQTNAIVSDLADKLIRPSNSLATTFENDLRNWLSVIGCSFEQDITRSERSFCFTINIPARRGYDRVIVLGVHGEARADDCVTAERLASDRGCSEAWVVAPFRVSPAARDNSGPSQSKLVTAYTFDELIDLDADFSHYVDWLENEVRTRGIDRNYVPVSCSRDEVDSATGRLIKRSRFAEQEGWTEGYLDRWLEEPAKEHISILGEFGTGKTWLTLHYAWKCVQNYKSARSKGLARPRLPIVVPLRDYAKAVSAESLFSEFFFRKHEINLKGYSIFDYLNRNGKFLLIFDGFDEMADKIDRQKMINNFWELAKVVVPGAKALLTCRTEHFPSAKEGKALLSAELQASTTRLTGQPPQFEVLELEKFNTDQIRKLFSVHTSRAIIDRVLAYPGLGELASRPVMSDLIISALPDVEAGRPINMARIYLYATVRKMRRDIRDARTFTSLSDKMFFLCELALEMLVTDTLSINFKSFPERIRRLFGPVVESQKDLDHWHYDMMGQTILIRNSDGDYSFEHKSFVEFFAAYKCAGLLGVLLSDFEDPARDQGNDTVDPRRLALPRTWSDHFSRQQTKNGMIEKTSPLERFETDTIDVIEETVGAYRFDRAILDLFYGMIDSSRLDACRKIIQSSSVRSSSTSFLISNLLQLLCRAGEKITSLDISGARATTATLSGKFEACNFDECDLSGSNFEYGTYRGCSFRNAFMSEIVVRRGWLTRQHDRPGEREIHYIYDKFARDPDTRRIHTDPIAKESVLVACVKSSRVIWKTTVQGPYVLATSEMDGQLLLLMLGSAGLSSYVSIDLEDGRQRVASPAEVESLLLWSGADLTGVRGLDDRNALMLRALGAQHVGPVGSVAPDSF